jgi:hypothetical protein
MNYMYHHDVWNKLWVNKVSKSYMYDGEDEFYRVNRNNGHIW